MQNYLFKQQNFLLSFEIRFKAWCWFISVLSTESQQKMILKLFNFVFKF